MADTINFDALVVRREVVWWGAGYHKTKRLVRTLAPPAKPMR